MPIFSFLIALWDVPSYSSSWPDPPGWAHHDTGTVKLIYLTALDQQQADRMDNICLGANVFGHEGSASEPQYPPGQNNQNKTHP